MIIVFLKSLKITLEDLLGKENFEKAVKIL